MLENFIYAKEKSLFEEALNNGEVLDEAIVFIEDTKEIWNHGTYFDGSTVDLSNIEASIQNILDSIPTKVSDLENDSGFITGEILTEVRDTLMSGPIQSLNNRTTRLENDKANKTELPTKTSDLINDNGFISNPIIPEQDGIYAITSDERIISLDEADETCIALALIKGPHKFWIDKYEHYSDETEIYLWNSSLTDTSIPNITIVGGGNTSSYGYLNPDGSGLNTDYTTWESGTALGDFNGYSNSEVLKTLNSNTKNIGYVMNQFNEGSVGNNLGHNDWYVPSAGQAAFFCLHRDELNTALTTIGGTELTQTSYWTSSEYASNDAWYINLWDYSVGMYSSNKDDLTEFKVRLIRDIRTLDERFDNKQNIISDLASIREGAVLGATAVQPEAISDMETKTNAAATYLKKTDTITIAYATESGYAEEAQRAYLDGNLRDIVETYATKTEIENKQDIGIKFSDVLAEVWVEDETYSEFKYRCDMACSGVTPNMYAEVAFAMEQATSGNYAPVCETKTNIVSIWSKKDESIVIPVIIITK